MVASAGPWVPYMETLVWVFKRWSVNSCWGHLVNMVSFQRLGVRQQWVLELASKLALAKLPGVAV